MSLELLYTSAAQGLKQGSRGFCTVLSTSGMPLNLAQRLERLSAYRHLFAPQDPQAGLNPVCYSHLRMTVGGRQLSVLSRVAAYGVDYSQRSNKIAHHVVLDPEEYVAAGPAWALQQPGVIREEWDGSCETPGAGPRVPAGDVPPSICTKWQAIAGDAGWAGVLADAWAQQAAGRPVWLIYEAAQAPSLLGLIAEACAILPQQLRWQATFSTYCTNLPPDIECRVRGAVAGSEEARLAGARGVVVDLTNRQACTAASAMVEAAREGRTGGSVKINESATTQPTDQDISVFFAGGENATNSVALAQPTVEADGPYRLTPPPKPTAPNPIAKSPDLVNRQVQKSSVARNTLLLASACAAAFIVIGVFIVYRAGQPMSPLVENAKEMEPSAKTEAWPTKRSIGSEDEPASSAEQPTTDEASAATYSTMALPTPSTGEDSAITVEPPPPVPLQLVGVSGGALQDIPEIEEHVRLSEMLGIAKIEGGVPPYDVGGEFFEIVDGVVYVRANTVFDYEVNPSPQVRVEDSAKVVATADLKIKNIDEPKPTIQVAGLAELGATLTATVQFPNGFEPKSMSWVWKSDDGRDLIADVSSGTNGLNKSILEISPALAGRKIYLVLEYEYEPSGPRGSVEWGSSAVPSVGTGELKLSELLAGDEPTLMLGVKLPLANYSFGLNQRYRLHSGSFSDEGSVVRSPKNNSEYLLQTDGRKGTAFLRPKINSEEGIDWLTFQAELSKFSVENTFDMPADVRRDLVAYFYACEALDAAQSESWRQVASYKGLSGNALKHLFTRRNVVRASVDASFRAAYGEAVRMSEGLVHSGGLLSISNEVAINQVIANMHLQIQEENGTADRAEGYVLPAKAVYLGDLVSYMKQPMVQADRYAESISVLMRRSSISMSLKESLRILHWERGEISGAKSSTDYSVYFNVRIIDDLQLFAGSSQ